MSEAKPIVYLVDDNASFLHALSCLLTLAGHRVETFASATEFLARHQPQNRGCVITDLRMPGPSGLDLQSALLLSEQSAAGHLPNRPRGHPHLRPRDERRRRGFPDEAGAQRRPFPRREAGVRAGCGGV